MKILVTVEPIGEGRYRATSSVLGPITAEGTSPASAVEQLRRVIDQKIAAGLSFTTIEIVVPQNRLVEFAGMGKDDSLHREWAQAVSEYRSQVDREEMARDMANGIFEAGPAA